jgi:hypothetical protein
MSTRSAILAALTAALVAWGCDGPTGPEEGARAYVLVLPGGASYPVETLWSSNRIQTLLGDTIVFRINSTGRRIALGTWRDAEPGAAISNWEDKWEFTYEMDREGFRIFPEYLGCANCSSWRITDISGQFTHDGFILRTSKIGTLAQFTTYRRVR